MLDQHRAFGRVRDGPQAKHVPRGQRGLGRGSITVSLITLTYSISIPKSEPNRENPNRSAGESDTGTEITMSGGAGEAPEDDPADDNASPTSWSGLYLLTFERIGRPSPCHSSRSKSSTPCSVGRCEAFAPNLLQ